MPAKKTDLKVVKKQVKETVKKHVEKREDNHRAKIEKGLGGILDIAMAAKRIIALEARVEKLEKK